MTEHHHGAVGAGTSAQRRALRWALWLNGGYLLVELAGSAAFGSLALLADAGHMLTDVAALGVALLAFRLAERPASSKHSYGLQRAELLAAMGNAVGLALIAGWVAVQAISRLDAPPDVEGGGMLVVASLGLVVNGVAAAVLARHRSSSLNIRGALLHLFADALGSIGAIAAAVAVLVFDAAWADPAVSLLIAALVVASVWTLLRDASHMVLEGTPAGIDPETIAVALHDAAHEVDRVHHLHIWQLSSGSTALSGHVVASNVNTLHEAQLLGDRLKDVLGARFGIDHATLELECHDCRGQTLVTPEEVVSRRRS